MCESAAYWVQDPGTEGWHELFLEPLNPLFDQLEADNLMLSNHHLVDWWPQRTRRVRGFLLADRESASNAMGAAFCLTDWWMKIQKRDPLARFLSVRYDADTREIYILCESHFFQYLRFKLDWLGYQTLDLDAALAASHIPAPAPAHPPSRTTAFLQPSCYGRYVLGYAREHATSTQLRRLCHRLDNLFALQRHETRVFGSLEICLSPLKQDGRAGCLRWACLPHGLVTSDPESFCMEGPPDPPPCNVLSIK